jgi:hypothetical protein
MVDRYGDDMDFERKWGPSMRTMVTLPRVEDQSDNNHGDNNVNKLLNKDDNSKKSQELKQGTKDLEQSLWDSWKKHAANKDIVWDGKNYVPNTAKVKKKEIIKPVIKKSEKSTH